MVSFAGLFEVTAIDFVLLVLFVYVVYKLFFKKREIVELPMQKQVEPLKKQDLTVEQLKQYNGVDDEHICLAICGKIYDVTRGKDFYGPDGAYGALAGHDATRALAKMDIKLVKDEYDDLTGLNDDDLEEAKEWEQRMAFKYPFVGRLLSPDEKPNDYEEVPKNIE